MAHSAGDGPRPQRLEDHLWGAARLAERFALVFGAGELGRLAGLWHDLGKTNPEFQEYLAYPGKRKRGPDHSSAGAVLAEESSVAPVAFAVAGHHGGLPAFAELRDERLPAKRSDAGVTGALDVARASWPEIVGAAAVAPELPDFLRDGGEHTAELFIRMLYSCLVDADFLDTERHMALDKAEARAGERRREYTPARLADVLDRAYAVEFGGLATSPVNRVRAAVHDACVAAAAQPPGFFTLTVPTGGGKTLSSLAFALRHAATHGLERVIVVIPYRSIIEQTAAVYRGLLGDAAVLEHHSGVEVRGDADTHSWADLAAENWDAPIVVTTTVQLFDSLFANRPAKCRKLHNIARSVLVLDEPQTLPAKLLDPVLDVVRELVAHYGVSAVLCSATQPAWQSRELKHALDDARELAPDPMGLFETLKRVEYEIGCTEDWGWSRVAQEMIEAEQCLAIVDTKADAMKLLDALDDSQTLHVSTLLCGAHRLGVLEEVRARLRRGEPCRLVSTQVVEAGVDLDFPVVLRALGPLDRIVQAAGRCNREGKCASGRVVVFQPADGASPPGEYKTGTGVARTLLCASEPTDLHDAATYEKYFRRLYQGCDTDAKKVQAARARLDFPRVADLFGVIEDDSVPVVVDYRRGDEQVSEPLALVDRVRSGRVDTRWALRRLQPFMVGVRRRDYERLREVGDIEEVLAGLGVWRGRYDPVRGIGAPGFSPDQLVV